MFRARVLITRRSKLHYTASGIGRLVHETATYTCDDTRGCVMQFWPPGDEHMCSKHVESWNKLIVKQILFIKLVNYWDKYTEMYGRQSFEINLITIKFSLYTHTHAHTHHTRARTHTPHARTHTHHARARTHAHTHTTHAHTHTPHARTHTHTTHTHHTHTHTTHARTHAHTHTHQIKKSIDWKQGLRDSYWFLGTNTANKSILRCL
jgi:hypothetical protein